MSTTLLFNSQQLGLDVNGRRENNPFIGIRKSKGKSMSNNGEIVKNRSFYRMATIKIWDVGIATACIVVEFIVTIIKKNLVNRKLISY